MDNVKFGKFIRQVRREKGLTQQQLADMLHVSNKAVSKWENGIGFPDIKLLEPLAECLDVSLLELMKGERMEATQMETEDAARAVAETVARSEQEEERKKQMWKIRLLLAVSLLGALYLAVTAAASVSGRNVFGTIRNMRYGEETPWYADPVLFYLWIGLLIMGCGAAAFYILWKSERLKMGVKIGNHWVKGLLTVLMDMLVVLLLHTCITNIAVNEAQLSSLPDAIPVKGYISNKNGSSRTDLDISDQVVQGLLSSAYVKNLNLTVQLKADAGYSDPEVQDSLDYLYGVNRMEAVSGFSEDSVVWNTGMDGSIFSGSERLCVVSEELMEKRGWKLGDTIELDQYYFYRGGYHDTELYLDHLEKETYEIAGYSDMEDILLETTGWVYPDMLVPLNAVRAAYERNGIPFSATSAEFEVKDSLSLNAFKQEMRDLGLKQAAPMSTEISYEGNVLNLNDSVFIGTASRLMELIDTVRAFLPFLLFLIFCAGYLVTFLLLHSRKREMALLRSIGVSRFRCFWIFYKEQLLLAAAGIFLGSLLSVLLQGNYGGGSVLTGCLVGVCYMLGNGLALGKLLKVSVMEALFRAD